VNHVRRHHARVNGGAQLAEEALDLVALAVERLAEAGEGAFREKTSGYAAFKSETQRKTLSSRRNPRQRHVDVGVQIGWQDEARVGQMNGITRRWARRGSRPSAPKDQ
jgi:hypothetical protein